MQLKKALNFEDSVIRHSIALLHE